MYIYSMKSTDTITLSGWYTITWYLMLMPLSWCQHYSDVIMGPMGSQITSLTIVYWTVYSGADQRKHQSSSSLAFVRGIHRWPVNFPHKWPVTRKMFPFDHVIMKVVLNILHHNWYRIYFIQFCYGCNIIKLIPYMFIIIYIWLHHHVFSSSNKSIMYHTPGCVLIKHISSSLLKMSV